VGEIVDIVRGPYLLTGREMINDSLATTIVQLMRTVPDGMPKGTLAGRGYTGVQELPGVGRVFVKQYAHGGLLRGLTGGRFLCGAKSRSRAEFDMLEAVRGFGVKAPQPYICVTKGSFFYQTWLIMEEIRDSRNLVEVSREDGDLLQDSMKRVAEQVLLLIKNKARFYTGSSQSLRELYLRRWRRAVIKHGLSPMLTELMSLTLRSYNE
jgi:3-deoxy-D-manno-octulosonic acid kinase